MFKIHIGVVPEYLRQIITNRRKNISEYNTGNKSQYDITRCKLEEFNRSFVPVPAL